MKAMRGWLCLWTMLLGAGGSVRAADFCVDTIAELQSALSAAAVSSADDLVRVVQGNYIVGDDIDYFPLLDGGALRLVGGYSGDCSTGVLTTNAIATKFTSSGAHQFRVQKLANDSTSELMNLRFDAFDHVHVAMAGCGSGSAMLRLFNVHVSNGGTASLDALSLSNNCGALRGYNLLLHDAWGDGLSVSADSATDTIDFVNLTSVNHGGRGLEIAQAGVATTRLWNGIVYGNDVDLYGNAGTIAVESSIYVSEDGAATFSGSNNYFSNPQLDAAHYPLPTSAAIDNGTHSVAIGLATTDLAGGSRISGAKVDRGAHEVGSSPGSILTVTNTNDSGAGSLRNALTNANAAPGRQHIEFNIAGACPHVIRVESVLPALTDLVSIDGYSQPGARANDSMLGFNAIDCVVIAADVSTMPHGLRLANSGDGGSEIVGLAFSGFFGVDNTAAAIRVVSGADHRIHGNQFGGSTAGFDLIPNRHAVAVEANAQRVEIGGGLEARNLISGSVSAAGVTIASTDGEVSVRGNLIGTSSTGLAADANSIGVQILGSPDNTISGNLISGNNGNGIEIRGDGADGNLIEDNRIGVKSFGFCLPPCTPNLALPNGGHGISIDLNFGDPESARPILNSLVRNEIAYNAGDGVNVGNGWGNQWTDNTVHDNGDLGVDLGSFGVNPIDDDTNQDPGATHGGINRPRILAASTEQISAEFSGLSGGYRISVYVNDSCDPSGFGEGRTLLAGMDFPMHSDTYATQPVTLLRPPGDDWSAMQGKQLTAIVTHLRRVVSILPPVFEPARGFSEFSQCFEPGQVDSLFADGFE